MTVSRRHALGLAALALLLPAGIARALEFERSQLTIRTQDGRRFPFHVELALTPEQRAQGLMYRESLDQDAGMLFIYDLERPVTMWMKNTLVPLDMLFLARDGEVLGLAEDTVPQSETMIPSGEPVKAVLELQAGTVARLALKPGDRVLHPLLVP
jgi:uncharacterized membrane protein (UPF0127 family)